MDAYLFLTSADSSALYPTNQPGDFLVHLPRDLILDGEWEVSLVDYAFPKPPQGVRSLQICADFCEHSIVGEGSRPILRRIQSNKYKDYFHLGYYIKVSKTCLRQIRVSLLDQQNKPIAFNRKATAEITLHLRRKPLRLC